VEEIVINSRIAIIVSALTIVSLVAPLQADNATLKDKYRAAEVDQFDVQPGVEFPPEYVADLQEQILKELEKSKEFQELLRPGQNPVTADSPVLRLTGIISSFNPGSRKKRYVVGYGAGAAEIYAHVVFLDRSTGRTLMTEEVRAVLSGGFFGGNAMNATQNFAKQVVNTTKLSLRKRLSTEHDSEGTHNGASAALDRQQLTISSKDWEGAERTLNEEGAAGYRLVEVRITGKNSANVVLERFSPKPDAYQYRLFHPYMFTSLQKDLNGAAEDGFRFCRHTLMALGNRFVLVAEKPGLPSAPRYSYRVHGTARISSAQHDIEKDQADGYTFIEEGEGPVHMFVLEKLVTAEKQ
jgi:hypothetical protein